MNDHKSLKGVFVVLFTLMISFSIQAENVEKSYKKLVSKYDVADEAKAVDKYSPADFWSAMIENNELLSKFVIDLKKNRGAEKEAIKRTAQIPRFYPQYDESVIEELQGFCDTLLIRMGIADLDLNCSLHIVYSNEVNAFTTLTENGFAMCLTSELITKKGINYNILMGYVAHEFAHGVLQHHIRELYAEAKERRKNELIGGIAIALNAVAAGVEAYNAGAYGIKPSGTDCNTQISHIENDIAMTTLRYSFKFSRDQEFEADLIAYRFMENLEREEEFINGLRLLGSQYDALYNEFSDHPTTGSRIEFLKFIKNNPDLGNTQNKKLRKRRLEGDLEW